MGGKRLVDMSYTTSESAEVRPRSFNRKSDMPFAGNKWRDDSTTPPGFFNAKFNSMETEGDADTWSIEQDPPRSAPSAKRYGYGDEKQDKDGHHQRRNNNLDFQIGRNHQVTNKRNLHRGLTETGESCGETTDEEFMKNCITNISSASSSISWAEDAVEAELTKKIFGLWDDVQKVITGETNDRPEDMTNQVFEECLRWKRVFPVQNLDRFSKYVDDGSTPTPIKVQKNRHVTSSRSTPNYKLNGPDSPNPLSPPTCHTPNPEKNSDYVSLWLSDCRSRVPEMSSSQETIVQDNFNCLPRSPFDAKESRSRSSTPARLNYNQMESDVTEPRAFNFNHHPPGLPAPTMSNSSNSNNLKNLHLRYSTEASEPDPTNFFTSLALDDRGTRDKRSSSNSMANARVYHEYHDGFSATSDTYAKPVGPRGTTTTSNSSGVANKLRVQRPISSNVKGHLLTPLSTKLSHLPHPPSSSSSLSLSKSFREQSFSNNSSKSTLPPTPFHHPLSSSSSYPNNFKYPNQNQNHTEDEEEEPPFHRPVAVDSGNESSDIGYFPNFPMAMSMSVSSPNRSIKSKSKSTVTQSSHPVFLPTIPSSPSPSYSYSYSIDRSSGPATRQRPFSKSTRTSVSVSNNNNNQSSISSGAIGVGTGVGVGVGGGSSSSNNNNNNSAYVKSRMFDYISDSGSGSGLERVYKYTGPKGPSSVSSTQSQPHSNNLSSRGLMSGNSGIGSASSSSGGGGGGGIGPRTSIDSGATTLLSGFSGTNWSRHSSISESFSFKLQNNTNINYNSNSNSDSISNSNNTPTMLSDTTLSMMGMGSGSGSGMTTTTISSDSINDDYFPHQLYPPYDLDSHSDAMNMRKLRRPGFLAVSKEAEFPGISTFPSSSSSTSVGKSKPVRPFLYWLLDKVSPS